MGKSKAIQAAIISLVMAYTSDLFTELLNIGGASLSDDAIDEMFDDTLVLKIGGSTPTAALTTDILTNGTAVEVDDEFQALKFARHLAMNASATDFDAQVVNGSLLTVASLTPISDAEDLSTVSIAEKILRCIENKYSDLGRQSLSYRTVISNTRALMA